MVLPADDIRSFPRSIVIVTICLLIALAWHNRFILDDAFISFRYAKNLVDGFGLVFNLGERVEGYTNFLWTILMVVPHYFGVDPVTFSYGAGMLLFLVTLVCTYATAALVLESRMLAWVVVLTVGTNYTFSAFATGGLETQLQACLVAACFLVVAVCMRTGRWSASRLMGLSLLMAAALLTRLDSAIFVGIVYAAAVWYILSGDEQATRSRVARIVSLTLPAVLAVAPWLAWKFSFYGDVLPNSYYAKVASATSILRGCHYVFAFFLRYWLLPLVIVFLLCVRRLEGYPLLQVMVAALGAWLVYVVSVGGDFMEFRLMVPVIPMLATLFVWSAVQITSSRLVHVGLLALVLCGSLYHGVTFRWDRNLTLESIHALREHLTTERWAEVGKALGQVFQSARNVVIATPAAGATPYYAGLPTVDLLGLNDRWVGKYGPVVSDHPGHQRRAPLQYLLHRKVNLIILLVEDGDNPPPGERRFTRQALWQNWSVHVLFRPDDVPKDSCMVSIPTGKGFRILAWYLTKNPSIDELIMRKGWPVFAIEDN